MKIGFIGTGNMGGALARAVAKSDPSTEIFLADHDEEKATLLADEIGGTVIDNAFAAQNCDFLFLGVKPQVLPLLMKEIAPVLSERETEIVLVTMAAGISMEKLQELAQKEYPIIRIMPNTPVAVGKGVILYCVRGVCDRKVEEFKTFLSAAGTLLPLDEGHVDAGGCVSGCGPAFAYLFIEALADGGVACGLTRDTALQCAAETVRGAAEMVLATGQHPAQLKDAVCSPAGTTIKGVEALENGGFRAAAMGAVEAAFKRTLELKG